MSGLGTASFGLVEATKAYRGGVSNIGFSFVENAVGFTGPPAPIGATVPPWLIADRSAYDHGDHRPSGDPAVPLAADGKWLDVAASIKGASDHELQTWPI